MIELSLLVLQIYVVSKTLSHQTIANFVCARSFICALILRKTKNVWVKHFLIIHRLRTKSSKYRILLFKIKKLTAWKMFTLISLSKNKNCTKTSNNRTGISVTKAPKSVFTFLNSFLASFSSVLSKKLS